MRRLWLALTMLVPLTSLGAAEGVTINLVAPVTRDAAASEPVLELSFSNARALEAAGVVAEVLVQGRPVTSLTFFGTSDDTARLRLPAPDPSPNAASVSVEVRLRAAEPTAPVVPSTAVTARFVR